MDRAEEALLLEVEDRPDHRENEDDPQLREVALDEATQDVVAGLLGLDLEIGRRGGAPPPARSLLILLLLDLPRLRPGDRRHDLLLARVAHREVARLRPSRSTKMRSATSNTSARLWLITTTAWPSRTAMIRPSTIAVWRTPSAWARRASPTGSPSSERAIATCWRCPRTSCPTSARTLVIVTASRCSSSPVRFSIEVSSITTRPARHRPSPTREEVLDDVEVVAEGEVLVDGRDAEVRGVSRSAIFTSLPSKRICPSSAPWMPAIAFTIVDLPAPLSHQRDYLTVMNLEVDVTPGAWTGPNLLLTPFRASTGGFAFIS